MALAVDDKEKFAEQVNNLANKDTAKAIRSKSGEIGKAERRIAELDTIISRIYEDHIVGKLTEERFKKMLDGYEAEQAALTTTAKTLRVEVEGLKSKTANLQNFMNLVAQHSQITDLTAEVARMFIEKIIVHEAILENASRRSPKSQEVHIFLSYIGEFNIE